MSSSSPPPPARDGVSVVIPVKNDLAHLRRVLADLARQSRRPDEVIVVDNGSEEDVATAARAAGARVVVQPEPGIPAAASAGYDAALFSLIARCDADSRLPGDWVQNLAAALSDHSVGAVTGPGTFYGLRGRAAAFRAPLSRLYMALYRGSMTVALGHPPLFGSTFAMRRELWWQVRDDVRRHGEGIHDDIDLSFPLGEHARIRWTRSMRVGISASPLQGGGALRLRRGWNSVVRRWPRDLPPKRIARRLARDGVLSR